VVVVVVEVVVVERLTVVTLVLVVDVVLVVVDVVVVVINTCATPTGPLSTNSWAAGITDSPYVFFPKMTMKFR
jgi:hypothetical protein